MKPTKSNLAASNCTPVSSNCVIWQGPCLEMLGIMTGDSITETTEKIATELCRLMELTDLTDLELDCIVKSCQGCPDPQKTISAVFELLINKVCVLEDLIKNTTDPEPTEEIMVRVASCFQTMNGDGDLVLDLPVSQYAKEIGLKVCTLIASVTNNTKTLANHEVRIVELEKNRNSGAVYDYKASPSCIYGTDLNLRPVDEMLEELEKQFCQLRKSTGQPSDLLQSVTKQCNNLSQAQQLSSPGLMSSLQGWKVTPATIADTITNLWLTLCDIRLTVASLKNTAAPTCESITVDFSTTFTNGNSILRLNFAGLSNIPLGFKDCSSQGSTLTIKDHNNLVYTTNADVSGMANSGNVLDIILSSTNLDVSGGNLTLTLNACLTNGSITCNKTVLKTVTPPSLCGEPKNLSIIVTSTGNV